MIAIAIATYNCPHHIHLLLKSLVEQTYKEFKVIVADDGSMDETVQVIKSYKGQLDLMCIELEHGERGIARKEAIDAACQDDPQYLLFIDADMYLDKHLLEYAVQSMEKYKTVDGFILREKPYSLYTNFFTKVKLFERRIINNFKYNAESSSIEAARFWKTDSYLKTGGINSQQIAFEEIQPTIRCLELGGRITKLHRYGVHHDEKKVTLIDILKKKNYYFSKMTVTAESETKGYSKAMNRWYFFRRGYYQKNNAILYLFHPLLFLGMIAMYCMLTLIGGYHLGIKPMYRKIKKA